MSHRCYLDGTSTRKAIVNYINQEENCVSDTQDKTCFIAWMGSNFSFSKKFNFRVCSRRHLWTADLHCTVRHEKNQNKLAPLFFMGSRVLTLRHQLRTLHSSSSTFMCESTRPSDRSRAKASGIFVMGGSRKLNTDMMGRKKGPTWTKGKMKPVTFGKCASAKGACMPLECRQLHLFGRHAQNVRHLVLNKS